MRHKLAVFGLFLAIIAGAMFGLAGCGDQPTSPLNSQNDGLSALSWVDESGVDPFAEKDGKPGAAGVKVDADAAIVTPLAGGKVSIELESGPSELSVPPGAVRLPLFVTAVGAQVQTPVGKVTLYDFGPDGLVFRKASTLELTVDNPDGTLLSLFWYDPATHRWVVQASCAVKNGKVNFSVYHFSKYGIA